jgi:hypothetical protein
MPVISSLQALVHPQTQKILSCMDCHFPTATSQNSPFLIKRSADEELWISIFQGIVELVSSENPDLMF